MSIATVVTRGFSSFGSIPLVTTMGYSIGTAIDSPYELINLTFRITRQSDHELSVTRQSEHVLKTTRLKEF